jgi:hypothetical protein
MINNSERLVYKIDTIYGKSREKPEAAAEPDYFRKAGMQYFELLILTVLKLLIVVKLLSYWTALGQPGCLLKRVLFIGSGESHSSSTLSMRLFGKPQNF